MDLFVHWWRVPFPLALQAFVVMRVLGLGMVGFDEFSAVLSVNACAPSCAWALPSTGAPGGVL